MALNIPNTGVHGLSRYTWHMRLFTGNPEKSRRPSEGDKGLRSDVLQRARRRCVKRLSCVASTGVE